MADPDNTVALLPCPDYSPARVEAAVRTLFGVVGFAPSPGERVLVKPNLIAAKGSDLCCTHKSVVRAVCLYCLDQGAKPFVADSPAFGTAPGVAQKRGYVEALAGLAVPIRSLRSPKTVKTSFGEMVAISADALDADRIVSLPKLKVHSQLRLTIAVKNLYGCIPGPRKALYHSRYGEKSNRFEALILDVLAALPPVVGLVDGVIAMHVHGPMNGKPFTLGLLGASANPVALDAALYALLGETPDRLVLWAEAIQRGLPGTDPAGLAYPLHSPADFDASGFVFVQTPKPVSFHPVQLVKSTLKRLWSGFYGR